MIYAGVNSGLIMLFCGSTNRDGQVSSPATVENPADLRGTLPSALPSLPAASSPRKRASDIPSSASRDLPMLANYRETRAVISLASDRPMEIHFSSIVHLSSSCSRRVFLRRPRAFSGGSSTLEVIDSRGSSRGPPRRAINVISFNGHTGQPEARREISTTGNNGPEASIHSR